MLPWLQIIRQLLDAGSETDTCETKSNHSPLYAAVEQNYLEAARMLISSGKHCVIYQVGSRWPTEFLIL